MNKDSQEYIYYFYKCILIHIESSSKLELGCKCPGHSLYFEGKNLGGNSLELACNFPSNMYNLVYNQSRRKNQYIGLYHKSPSQDNPNFFDNSEKRIFHQHSENLQYKKYLDKDQCNNHLCNYTSLDNLFLWNILTGQDGRLLDSM